MKAIWKFPISITSGPQKVAMPSGSTIVHVREQHGRPTLWATVFTDSPTVTREFHVYATGEAIEIPVHRYIGTIVVGWTDWHVFEATG